MESGDPLQRFFQVFLSIWLVTLAIGFVEKEIFHLSPDYWYPFFPWGARFWDFALNLVNFKYFHQREFFDLAITPIAYPAPRRFCLRGLLPLRTRSHQCIRLLLPTDVWYRWNSTRPGNVPPRFGQSSDSNFPRVEFSSFLSILVHGGSGEYRDRQLAAGGIGRSCLLEEEMVSCRSFLRACHVLQDISICVFRTACERPQIPCSALGAIGLRGCDRPLLSGE